MCDGMRILFKSTRTVRSSMRPHEYNFAGRGCIPLGLSPLRDSLSCQLIPWPIPPPPSPRHQHVTLYHSLISIIIFFSLHKNIWDKFKGCITRITREQKFGFGFTSRGKSRRRELHTVNAEFHLHFIPYGYILQLFKHYSLQCFFYFYFNETNVKR